MAEVRRTNGPEKQTGPILPILERALELQTNWDAEARNVAVELQECRSMEGVMRKTLVDFFAPYNQQMDRFVNKNFS